MKVNKVPVQYEIKRTLMVVFGAFLFAFGTNVFTVPVGLYNAGFVGLSQLIRTILADVLHINVGSVDISGIIYFLLNVPVMLLGLKVLGKLFMIKTLVGVGAITLFLSVIPIPATPILEDTLSCSLIGGIIAGYGIGVVLKNGGSGGGLDIIGMYFAKTKNFGVGRVSMIINVAIYAIVAMLQDISVAIYSIIYTVVYSLMIDRTHSQNINVQVLVITKTCQKEISAEIMREMGRGVTLWGSRGAYTGDEETILYVLISKYEISQLRRIVYSHSPEAFVIVNEGVDVSGNFLKKL